VSRWAGPSRISAAREPAGVGTSIQDGRTPALLAVHATGLIQCGHAVLRRRHPASQRSLQPDRAGQLRLLQRLLRFLLDLPRQAVRGAPAAEVVEDVTGLPDSIKARVRRVFLADGDALALSRRRLEDVLALLRRELPALERVSCYANAQNLLKKSPDDLRAICEAGLELLYLGLESGDDATLAAIHKGVTAAQQIEGCARASAAGFALSVTAILGLAGPQRSRGTRRPPARR